MLKQGDTGKKTHQHPNRDRGGNLVLGTLTLALLVGSNFSKASVSEDTWYLGAIAGSRSFVLLGIFFGLGKGLPLRRPCIMNGRTAAVIGLDPYWIQIYLTGIGRASGKSCPTGICRGAKCR